LEVELSGIAGILSKNDHDSVKEMLAKIEHRGTTASRIWEVENGALGALGIDVLGEEPGPVATTSENRAIVWDGWLKNSADLRQRLEFHNLKQETDAETVLHLYEELGPKAFSELEGEFAFGILEGDHMLLARDRLGVCPLYYGFHNGDLCFASEIKALSSRVACVREFPAGNYFISDQGMFAYEPYLPEPVQLQGAQDSAERLGVVLERAVEERLIDGVEVGVWLSGGVDSSVVAALARPMKDRLYTFSAGVEGAPDLAYARQVADHIGAIHQERTYGLQDVLDVIEKVIYQLESFDMALVRSAVANYLVAELAAEQVAFVLSGEGGDELFAGYAYQKEFEGEVELTLSVQDAIASLHNTALQRVDRSASAHSTRAFMPFLDSNVVRYALAVPSRWKIRGSKEVEKWPLRQALADRLPSEIIWRGKVKFWQGAGAANMLAEHAETVITDSEFQAARHLQDGLHLKSKEELYYYRIFESTFGKRVPLEEIGRTQHI
jgi:asparagine synthase (glutamine-hydrolysing)